MLWTTIPTIEYPFVLFTFLEEEISKNSDSFKNNKVVIVGAILTF